MPLPKRIADDPYIKKLLTPQLKIEIANIVRRLGKDAEFRNDMTLEVLAIKGRLKMEKNLKLTPREYNNYALTKLTTMERELMGHMNAQGSTPSYNQIVTQARISSKLTSPSGTASKTNIITPFFSIVNRNRKMKTIRTTFKNQRNKWIQELVNLSIKSKKKNVNNVK